MSATFTAVRESQNGWTYGEGVGDDGKSCWYVQSVDSNATYAFDEWLDAWIKYKRIQRDLKGAKMRNNLTLTENQENDLRNIWLPLLAPGTVVGYDQYVTGKDKPFIIHSVSEDGQHIMAENGRTYQLGEFNYGDIRFWPIDGMKGDYDLIYGYHDEDTPKVFHGS